MFTFERGRSRLLILEVCHTHVVLEVNFVGEPPQYCQTVLEVLVGLAKRVLVMMLNVPLFLVHDLLVSRICHGLGFVVKFLLEFRSDLQLQ